MKASGEILLGFIGPIRTTEMDSIHMDPVDPMPPWEKGMLLRAHRGDRRHPAGRRGRSTSDHHGRDPAHGRRARLAGRQPERRRRPGGAYSVYVIGPAVPELAQVVPAIGKGVLGRCPRGGRRRT